jgi:hypothetical protein
MPCGGEDGSRRKKCNSRDQRMAAGSMLTLLESPKWKSVLEHLGTGQTFVGRCVPVRLLIEYSYKITDSQIVGGTDWMDSEVYDTRAEVGSLFWTLPADRFRLQSRDAHPAGLRPDGGQRRNENETESGKAPVEVYVIDRVEKRPPTDPGEVELGIGGPAPSAKCRSCDESRDKSTKVTPSPMKSIGGRRSQWSDSSALGLPLIAERTGGADH